MRRIGLWLLLLLVAAPAWAEVPAGFAIHQSLALDPATFGIDGALQMLEDSRIAPALRADMWQETTDPDLVLSEDDPLRKALVKTPLRSAHLRLIDAAGKLIADRALGVPLGDIDRQQLHDGAPSFLVSADRSLGAGSYAGLETVLMTVEHGQLLPEALPGGKALGRSLKNGWRIIDDTTPGAEGQPGTGKLIQAVACHPNWDNPAWAETEEFVVDLTTYSYAAGWHATTKTLVGYWESDQDWPEGFP